MFDICPSFKALFTCASILFTLRIIELHGLKCKRARKAEWANGTESLDSLCPYQKGIVERCYVLNCSDGNSTRADWGCVADFGDAHFQCSASCFNANGFACKCLLGAAGVDMANENMNIVVPPELLKKPCPTTTTTTSTTTTSTTTTTTPSTTTSTTTTLTSAIPSTFTATGSQITETASSAAIHSSCHLKTLPTTFLLIYAISRALSQ
ncbi:hypothetical protein GPALN_010355 [Globodera pallida]|nr:hypothetical protein GPALN_010355 [Globodera pallida]